MDACDDGADGAGRTDPLRPHALGDDGPARPGWPARRIVVGWLALAGYLLLYAGCVLLALALVGLPLVFGVVCAIAGEVLGALALVLGRRGRSGRSGRRG